MGIEFHPEAWGEISEDYFVELQQCRGCGFQFFDPALAGNEIFYQQLARPGYFSPTRPEFERTLKFARSLRASRVLDVGCGSGDFLELAQRKGLRTFGLELNRVAAEKARARGHVIFSEMLHELDLEKVGGGFDLVTLFQVLEHVTDPAAVLKQARSLLNPSGRISIAVPSSEGICRLSRWEPAQWPPHHVTWWRLRDFKRLAETVGMELVESGSDVLLGAEIVERWKLHNRMARVLGRPGLWGGDWLPALFGLGYRKAGIKFLFPRKGTSIYAYFKKT